MAMVSYITSRLPRCTLVWLRTRKPFSFASFIARRAFSSACGTPLSQSWWPMPSKLSLISVSISRALSSSRKSAVRKLPFVLSSTRYIPRLAISRTMSRNLGCSIGSPPVSVTLWMPQRSHSSRNETHSSQLNSPSMGALSAAMKQCRQLKLHFPVMAQFTQGK